MGWEGRADKENKFILGTERCENMKNLYINKTIIIIIIIIIVIIIIIIRWEWIPYERCNFVVNI